MIVVEVPAGRYVSLSSLENILRERLNSTFTVAMEDQFQTRRQSLFHTAESHVVVKRDSIACMRLRLHYVNSGTFVSISRDASNAALGVTTALLGLPIPFLIILVPFLTWGMPGLITQQLTSSTEFSGARIYRGRQAIHAVNRTRFVFVSLCKLLCAAFLSFSALLLLNRFVLLPQDFNPIERVMSLGIGSVMSGMAGYLVITTVPGLLGYFPGRFVELLMTAVCFALVICAGPAVLKGYYSRVVEPRLFREYLANRQNSTNYEFNVPEQLRRPDYYIENVTTNSCYRVKSLIERWHHTDPAWESVLAKANAMIKRIEEQEKTNPAGPGVRLQ